MLQYLSIENFVLIDKLSLNFSKGFTVITGETGAGKSIFLGALSIILGKRADKNVLNDTEKKCIVEGHFNISAYNLKGFFTKNDLDYEDVVILRREINKQGKSRAFINDTPVRLPLMKELGEALVDIHSQNHTLTLNNASVQMTVVDNYSGHNNVLSQYQDYFKKYIRIQKELQYLKEKNIQTKADQDYYQFLFDELDRADIIEGEDHTIEEELSIQNNSESIKESLTQSISILQEQENNTLDQIRFISQQINKISQYHNGAEKLSSRINSSIIELEDIASEMENISNNIHYDPERIEELSDRLNTLYQLQQKHRVSSLAELIEKRIEIDKKLLNISSLEADITAKEKEIVDLRKQLAELADVLTENRKKSIPYIEKEIKTTLTKVGMPDAEFKVKILPLDDFTSDGKDTINFLFSANKGISVQEISKIASGGEMSRLMLAVKSLIAKKNFLPTIIFDEIDSGISGDIAVKAGEIMKKMADEMQVIAITHLPQIASKGDNHLFIYKEKINNKTYSRIRILNSEEKIVEIAKMLSADNISDAAMQTAKELIAN